MRYEFLSDEEKANGIVQRIKTLEGEHFYGTLQVIEAASVGDDQQIRVIESGLALCEQKIKALRTLLEGDMPEDPEVTHRVVEFAEDDDEEMNLAEEGDRDGLSG